MIPAADLVLLEKVGTRLDQTLEVILNDDEDPRAIGYLSGLQSDCEL